LAAANSFRYPYFSRIRIFLMFLFCHVTFAWQDTSCRWQPTYSRIYNFAGSFPSCGGALWPGCRPYAAFLVLQLALLQRPP
jgi:hypothetical protein